MKEEREIQKYHDYLVDKLNDTNDYAEYLKEYSHKQEYSKQVYNYVAKQVNKKINEIEEIGRFINEYSLYAIDGKPMTDYVHKTLNKIREQKIKRILKQFTFDLHHLIYKEKPNS